MAILLYLSSCESGSGDEYEDAGSHDYGISCKGQATKPIFLQRKFSRGLVGGVYALFLDNVGIVMVDDSCSFWVETDPSVQRPWSELRSGKLSAVELNEILNEIKFSRWSSLPKYNPGPSGLYDYAETVFSDGRIAIRCENGCEHAEVDADVRFISDKLSQLRTRFLSSGEGLADGFMRIRVSDYRESSGFGPAQLWTFGIDVESLALEHSADRTGLSYLVTDERTNSELRALRGRYLDGDLDVPLFHLAIPFGRVEVNGKVQTEFGVGIRDAVPFEDASGIVRTEWGP